VLTTSDLFTKKTYRKLYKLYEQIKGIKMKKLLTRIILLAVPSYIFALAGFGLQFGQDYSKLDGSIEYQNEGTNTQVTVESKEMKTFPIGLGGYAFIDLFGFALEAEGDFAFGEYQFDFISPSGIPNLENIPFGWGRVSYAFTLKKNLMDISIPILAKAAINAGIGINGHTSTPRANIDMVKEIFEIEDLSEFNPNDNDLENELINYLKDNRIDASGFHVQAGLRFKILVLDSHLNFRYTIAENVYDGSNGFAQAMFKIGMAF
jgi:hypothetical protein